MGQEVDARTDIFAVGIILWELLAQQRLFLPAAVLRVGAARMEAAARGRIDGVGRVTGQGRLFGAPVGVQGRDR